MKRPTAVAKRLQLLHMPGKRLGAKQLSWDPATILALPQKLCKDLANSSPYR